MKNESSISISKLAHIIFITSIALLVCYLLKPVMAPLFLSIILALVVLPIVKWFERIGFNRLLSALTTVVLIGAFFLGIAIIGIFQLRGLLAQYGNLEQKFFQKINGLTEQLPPYFQPPTMREMEDVEKMLPDDLSTLGPVVTNILRVSSDLFTTVTMLPIFMFFILFYRGKLVRFVNKLEENNTGNIHELMQESKEVIQKYLSGMGLVILIIAALATIGLWALGIKYALLLGLLSAVLTIIPYIGTGLGALIPILFALLTKDSAAYGLGVAAMYIVIQIAESNLISPVILGNSVNVNPFISILSLLVLAQFWGIIGMVIAVPLTAIIVVLFSHSKKLSPLNILLKNDS